MTPTQLTATVFSMTTLILGGVVTPSIPLGSLGIQPAMAVDVPLGRPQDLAQTLPIGRSVSIAQTAASDSTRVYQQASPAVVTIKSGAGHGSGFIVSPDGWIITNAHVVADGPRTLTVQLSDGRQVPADVIGFAHKGVDLAALKIYGHHQLPFLAIAPTDSIQVGQDIFVIGTPLTVGYRNTLSRGIISRWNRQEGILQHDANTNAGNSGGPVLNNQGQVVGVHFGNDIGNRVYSPMGQPLGVTQSGINFAVSTDPLQRFLQAIKAGKTSQTSTLTPGNPQRKIPPLVRSGTVHRGVLDNTDMQLPNQALIDLYQWQSQAGQPISITLESNGFNPLLQVFQVDPTASQPRYVLVASNDDRGPADFNAHLTFSAPKTGLYYLGVTTSERGEQGRYTMHVQELRNRLK